MQVLAQLPYLLARLLLDWQETQSVVLDHLTPVNETQGVQVLGRLMHGIQLAAL